jgi:hypothetical protein
MVERSKDKDLEEEGKEEGSRERMDGGREVNKEE